MTRKKPKSQLQIHGLHKIKLIEGPIKTKNPLISHAGKFMCQKCNSLIKWASDEEVKFYKYRYGSGTNISTTYQGFVDRFYHHTHKPEPTVIQEQIIYLAVPYQEKDQAKAYGAKWDPHHRLWYIKSTNPHIEVLVKWLPKH
jgi:hypothetical protein